MNTREEEAVDHRAARLAARAEKYRASVARLRALRDTAAAELCSHGMPKTNCTAHRDTEPTEEQE